ncbi:MAG: hypothetical protein ACREMF_01645 [Gemmatimonadales bacterium]
MTLPDERRLTSERRNALDRRMSLDGGVEERRQPGDRRSGIERRLSILSASDQIHGALRLLTRVIESGAANEQERRSLEGAMLRLRFALDRLEDR